MVGRTTITTSHGLFLAQASGLKMMHLQVLYSAAFRLQLAGTLHWMEHAPISASFAISSCFDPDQQNIPARWGQESMYDLAHSETLKSRLREVLESEISRGGTSAQ